jgi:hypothetical protein
MQKVFKIVLIIIGIIFLLGGCLFLYLYLNPHPHDTSTYRNGNRLGKIRSLASSLELYFDDYKKYPETLDELFPKYGKAEPFSANGILQPRSKVFCSPDEQYQYSPLNQNKNFIIVFCLPENSPQYAGGYHILSPDGIK